MSNVLMTIMCLIILNMGCHQQQKYQNEKPQIYLRFKPIKTFMFSNEKDLDYVFKEKCATIYIDTETNIQYLYIWAGAQDGGPAITRLWNKEN